MALSSTCLWATLTEIKPWLRLVPSDVRDDAILEQLANSVTEEIERITCRIFLTRTITERFDSKQAVRFTLAGYPVTTNPLTTFTIDGTAVTTDQYDLNAAQGIVTLRYARESSVGAQNVVIAYTAGYARADIPADVLQVALEMLAFRYQDWGAGANGPQSVQFGAVQYVPRSAWPYHVKDALDRIKYAERVRVL